MPKARSLLSRLVVEETGQDLVEYAFLIVFIALLMIGVLQSTQGSIASVFQRIVATIGGAS